jgi:lysozyme
MTRAVPAIAVEFVRRAEAVRLAAYQDSAGVWTIGVGHTGPEVVQGLTATDAQADAWLAQDLAVAAGRLAARVDEPVILALTDHEYAALLSFVFNLGAGAGWTIWKVLNARRLDLVPDQIKRFDKARDPRTGALVDVPGLMHRRLAEVALWSAPDVDAAVAVVASAPIPAPPSSATRAADTPPTPAPVKPLARSKSFVASCASAAAGVAACTAPVVGQVSSGVKSVSDAIAPYADANDHIKQVQSVLMMAMAGLAVATVGLVWLKHRNAAAS